MAASGGYAIVAADLNGDGKPDLAVDGDGRADLVVVGQSGVTVLRTICSP